MNKYQLRLKKKPETPHIGCLVLLGTVVVSALCWLIYFLLETLAELIANRNKTITIVVVMAVCYGLLSLLIIGKLTEIIGKNLIKTTHAQRF